MNPLTAALTAMRRSPYQTLAALFIVTITFFVGYTFSMFLFASNHILQYFETRPQVIAFFELDATEPAIQELKQAMEKRSYVEDVKIVSKDQALKLYQDDNKDDPLMLELVTSDILPASIEVSGVDVAALSKIKTDLESVTIVDEVIFQESLIENLNTWTNSIRVAGVVSLSVLGITTLLIIMVITAMKVSSQRFSIQVMRMLGATRWYIKSPFVFEAMLYGLLGSLVGWGGMFTVLLYSQPSIETFLGPITFFPVDPFFLFAQIGIGTATGMILSALASDAAVGRMIKR